MDPFVGSGTTCEVAYKLRCNSVGIDIVGEYIELARKKINIGELLLFNNTKASDGIYNKG